MFTRPRTITLLVIMVLLMVACQPAPDTGKAVEVEREETAVSQPEFSPVEVTEAFYDWYLDTIGDRSDGEFTNPLIERLYQESEYLTADFVDQVDAVLEDTSQAAYDPILQAQDVPERIEVQKPAGDESAVAVVVLRYWGGNPDPSPMTVHLVQRDGRWLIDNVTAFEVPAENPPATFSAAPAGDFHWLIRRIGLFRN